MNKSANRPPRVSQPAGRDLRSEKLFALWSIATRRHLTDEERIQAILEESCRVLGFEIGFLGEVAGDKYLIRHAHDEGGGLSVGMELPLFAKPCRDVAERQATVLLQDLSADPATGEMLLVGGLTLRACAATPIWVGTQFWGVLAFAGKSSIDESRSEETIAFIELIAGQIGSFMLQARQRDNLEKLALTDPLTGLLNRRASEARLKEEISHAKRHDQAFILGLIDLDHFKLVNDRYGHAVGDEVLVGFSQALLRFLRTEDWVARWGGEEFIVCLHTADMQQALQILERLREEIRRQAFMTSVGAIHITLSVGLSRFDPETSSQDSVLADLDNTLYEAKSGGRDRVVSGRKGRGILHTATLLKTAASENRILAAYQTIHSLKTLEPVADEALARLQTHDGKIIPAADFIEAAEGLGLMAEIDSIVANLTMRRCATNLASGRSLPDFAHFINLSPQFLARRSMVEALLGQAQQYCSQCGVEMGRIKPVVFEITERQALQNLDTLENDLKVLLDFGFRLALDDFGSGYSSFLYLSRLPVSFLKVEGWMVQNLGTNRKVLDLVKAIAGFSRDQGIVTVAECVENEATIEILQEVGVDWAQGHFFGAPLLD